jgi:hypothetical protein
LLEFLHGDIQHESDTRWDALEIPDMCDRSGELDMTSSLTANLRGSHLDTTSLTYYTLVADTLVLAAGTLIVIAWAKNLLTEESASFWSLSSVVDRLGDEYFTI